MIVNLLLLRGNIGRPGRRPLPGARPLATCRATARGHQREAAAGLPRPRWRDVFGFEPPREHGSTPCGRDRGDAATAAARSSSRWAATSPSPRPTRARPAKALRRCDLTVHVATKLNRSHLVHGTRRADPALPRPHRDRPAGGRPAGRDGRGFDEHGARVARHERAGLASICCRSRRSSRGMAAATLGRQRRSTGAGWSTTTTASATGSRRVFAGFKDFNARVRVPRRLPPAQRGRASASWNDAVAARRSSSHGLPAGRRAAPAPRDRRRVCHAARRPLARPVQHDHLRPGRPLSRRVRPAPRGVHQRGRHRRAGLQGRRVGRHRRRPWTTASHASPRLPAGGLRHPARLPRRLLPRDQPAGAAVQPWRAARTPTSKSVLVSFRSRTRAAAA